MPIVFLSIYFGKEQMGRTFCVGFGGLLVAARVRWDLRRRFWFWGILVLMLALQIPLIFVVQWPRGWVPAIAMLPIALAECLIVLGVIQLVEKLRGDSASNANKV